MSLKKKQGITVSQSLIITDLQFMIGQGLWEDLVQSQVTEDDIALDLCQKADASVLDHDPDLMKGTDAITGTDHQFVKGFHHIVLITGTHEEEADVTALQGREIDHGEDVYLIRLQGREEWRQKPRRGKARLPGCIRGNFNIRQLKPYYEQ